MKKTIFIWTIEFLAFSLFIAIRFFLLGYKELPAWYWLLILFVVVGQIAQFIYYSLYGANIYKIEYQDTQNENELQFTFHFNPIKMSRTEFGLASFDPITYPRLMDPKVLQIILYEQTTRKEARILTDYNLKTDNNPIKTYKYAGKPYKIKFYPRPSSPGQIPQGKRVK